MKRMRARLSHRLSGMFELPCDVFGGVSVITLTSNRELAVDGCVRVEEYESDIIRLELCDRRLAVVGRDLSLGTFFGRSIRICGEITEVKLS